MEPGWFRPANFVAHVPLDDVTEEAFLGLEAIFVDDLCRVRDNPRRILGRLMADAKIRGPTGRRAAGIDWRGWADATGLGRNPHVFGTEEWREMITKERGFFTLSALGKEELESLMTRSCALFRDQSAHDQPLRGKVVGVLFTKPSTRTRTAFTVGTVRLGGFPVTYGPGDLQTNTGESIQDTGRVLGCMLDALVARTAGPVAEIRELSRHGGLPVINAMTAEEHPTQGVCDLATMLLEFGSLDRLSVLYVGEGNNTAVALANGLSRMPHCRVTFATPAGYGLAPEVIGDAAKRAKDVGGSLAQVHDMDHLPDEVDLVYTTRWQTTGTVKDAPDWREKFRAFHVDEALMRRWPSAKFMHDLPAHRGEEVSGAVLEGPRSIAWTQARMKLTSAMAVLERVLGNG